MKVSWCSTSVLAPDVHRKDAVCFNSVQGFVRTVLSIFIRVTADNRGDVVLHL